MTDKSSGIVNLGGLKGGNWGGWVIRQDKTYKPAVADAPSHHTPSVTLCANLEWEDLGWVQPGDRKPCRAKYGGEEENEKGSCDSGT